MSTMQSPDTCTCQLAMICRNAWDPTITPALCLDLLQCQKGLCAHTNTDITQLPDSTHLPRQTD